jgi:hypothetical protein
MVVACWFPRHDLGLPAVCVGRRCAKHVCTNRIGSDRRTFFLACSINQVRKKEGAMPKRQATRSGEEHKPKRQTRKRGDTVYLDYLQNRRGQTLAAAYSLRPREGAPVSTPLHWNEVRSGLDPQNFTMKNIFKRVSKVGDLWKPVLGKGINLEKCLDALANDGQLERASKSRRKTNGKAK